MNTPNEVNSTTHDGQDGTWIAIKDITVPEDARIHTPEDIDSRAQSMAKEGQLQNALLSREGDRLVLVYGHGRLLSAQKLGWEKLRCDIKEGLTETQKLLMTLAENEEREDVSPFYTAKLYQRIMAAEHITKGSELAAKLGKDEGDVSRLLALVDLPADVREKLERSNFSMGQLREFLRLPNPEQQIQLAKECVGKDYSVRELQARVKQLLNPKAEQDKPQKPAEPAFQFKWKGRLLQIKVRPFDPDHENWSSYSVELDDAAGKFRAAFPLPELPQASDEAKQAA